MKAVNEVGNRYGRLVVIERAGSTPKGYVTWLCKCDCGNEKVVRGDCLRHGQTKSCGCYRKELFSLVAHRRNNRKFIDETGNRYGRLLVVRRGGSSSTGAKWVCKCDCGNYIEVRGMSLRRGNTTSCGCYRRERQALAHGWIERLEEDKDG